MWKTYHVKARNNWAVQHGQEEPLAHVESKAEADNLVNVLNYYVRKEQEAILRERFHA